jgi:hypothetical protein
MLFSFTFTIPKDVGRLEHFEIDIRRCLYSHLLGDNFFDLVIDFGDKKEAQGTLKFSVKARDGSRVPETFEVTSCELDHSSGGIPSIKRVCETLFVRRKTSLPCAVCH